MVEHERKYVIVGGGLAGASAVEGIREVDDRASISLIGAERHLPYNRPPLTKKLWFGKQTVEDIFVEKADYYSTNGAEVVLDVRAVEVDDVAKTVRVQTEDIYHYDKLLLATGGAPRRLPVPGGELDGVCYYRYLDDYEYIRERAADGKSAIVIGGGFIGSEIAAALSMNGVDVSLIFPDPYICARVLPRSLAFTVQEDFGKHGITIFSEDSVESIEKNGQQYVAHTKSGGGLKADIVIVGIGLTPSTALAQTAGLQIDNGIVVNERLQSSNPDIYAAGDNAKYPYQSLGVATRVEHWDNALNQGKQAGRNMAGAGEEYTYMPYFFSDLFDFGYEAVGEVDSRLDIVTDWQQENQKGVVYYLRDRRVRGAMMVNVWDKVPDARELIKSGRQMDAGSLKGAIG